MTDRLIHPPGLVYFWALNDECRPEKMDAMIDAFAAGSAAAVVLHPRPGLLLPYGGDDWFAMIRRTVEKCHARGLQVWLYDEDPYPSGAAGGRIVAEHPEYEALGIEQFVFDQPGLCCFPMGQVCWVGFVRESDGQTIDLTRRIGTVRRDWKYLKRNRQTDEGQVLSAEVAERDAAQLKSWDSRWYYPNTPLYECERTDAYAPEFAIAIHEIPAGYRLLAYVARPAGRDSTWGHLPDSLNPQCTQLFLQLTHERYRQTVGEFFGKTIPAIFTDEPKCFANYPWTPGIFEDFQKQVGYDLRPRLWRLFTAANDEVSRQVRVDYRTWCGERLRSAWLEPVARWCHEHKLQLLGHISPEDDPVQQVACVGNLFPLYQHFDLPGLDLIIPAVGDQRHPLINLGVIAAASAAQQQNKPGVMSESLGCSGHASTVADAARILRWQLLMGVTTHVVHCAFNSMAGPRHNEAPPDYGPFSERWSGMVALGKELAGFQAVIRDATQIAPVAVLWPIREFMAQPFEAYTHTSPLRDQFVEFVRQLLDRQVGVHFIDEADVGRATAEQGRLTLGRASYSHVLIPPGFTPQPTTLAKLRSANVQTSGELPRLVNIAGDATDFRCTAWEKDGQRRYLLMNLNATNRRVQVNGRPVELPGGQIVVFEG